MKRYTYRSQRKNKKEKVGFITAFSICAVAIGLALWSTYLSISDVEKVKENTYISTYPRETMAVNNEVTGVTETVFLTEATETVATIPTVSETLPSEVTEPTLKPYTGDSEALQTILQVAPSLEYPVRSQKILRQYSDEAIYSETMGDYRIHSGVDFEADIAENIMAMSDGVVESIYYDDMLGNVIVVRNGTFSVKYCGVSEIMYCSLGDMVSRGDILAKVGSIPCEAADENHLHIEVLVGDKTIDPMTVISNNQ